MLPSLNDVWHKDWSSWLGAVQTFVGTGLVMVHELSTNPDIHAALMSMGFSPRVTLYMAVIGVVTMVAAPHREHD